MKELVSFVIKADTPNLNNRIYPKAVLEKAIEDFKKLPPLTMIGQLGMPSDAKVSLAQASHFVKDMSLNSENELMVSIQTLDTPSGQKLEEMIEKDSVAFRMHGIGASHESYDANGSQVIEDSYRLVSINAVSKEEAS